MPDLATLNAVKTLAGIKPEVKNADLVLQSLITSTSADFMRETQRVDLLSASYTEARVGDGSTRLVLRHWPITAVTSLNLAGIAVPSFAETGSTGWLLDGSTDPERDFVLYVTGMVFQDAAPVTVTYTAGYASVPADIEQAVAEWVVFRNNKRNSAGQTEQRSVEGERSTADLNAMPANTQRVVEKYTRHWPSYGRTPNTSQAVQPVSVVVAGGGAGKHRMGRG